MYPGFDVYLAHTLGLIEHECAGYESLIDDPVYGDAPARGELVCRRDLGRVSVLTAAHYGSARAAHRRAVILVPMPRRGSTIRFLVLVLILGGCAVWVGLSETPSPGELGMYVADVGPLGPVIVVVASALLLVVLIPRSILAAMAGLVFGSVTGAVYALAASALGALAAFAVGRWLGRDFVAARESVARLDAWIAGRGAWGVIVVRLLPVAPFGLTSYAFGTTGVSLGAYLIGTAVASVPSTLVYTSLGAAALRPGSAAFWWSLAAATVLGIGGAAVTMVTRRRGIRTAESPHEA
jgi:uncharacterized membrane protein YdjX (TVP38/TMEM64 family)